MAEIKPISGVDDRVKLASVIPLDTPFTLNVFPTNACNFACNYCAQSLGVKGLKREYDLTPESMKIDVLESAVDQAKAFPDKFKLVSMMGHGEPLVHQRLPEMISIVRQGQIAERIDLITNGSLLNKDKSRELIDAGVDVIRISLQGLSCHKYKQVSNVNLDFDELVANIAFAYNHRKMCKVFVKIVDVGLEAGDKEKFYEIFDKISDRMYIENIKPVYDGIAYSENVWNVTTDRYGYAHQKRFICPQPFYMLSLWPNGDVASCDAIYRANKLGNVNDESLLGMWNSQVLRSFRVMQLEGKRDNHPVCKRCCASDDVAHPADVLDYDAVELLKRL